MNDVSQRAEHHAECNSFYEAICNCDQLRKIEKLLHQHQVVCGKTDSCCEAVIAEMKGSQPSQGCVVLLRDIRDMIATAIVNNDPSLS